MQSELKPCPFCGSDRLMVLPPTCDRDTPYSAADRAYPVVRCSDCYTDVPGKDFDASSKSAVEAWNRRSALVDVPAVEPVAHIIEGPSGEDPRVYLTQKYDPRSPDFWLNEEARAKHRVTPLYASPPLSREGEDSAEVERLRDALEKISDGYGPNHLSAFCRNTSREALAATRSASATTAKGISE